MKKIINEIMKVALTAPTCKPTAWPIRETDEAACVAWLTRLYEEKEGESL